MLRHSCLCGGLGLILIIAIAAKAFHILAQMSASTAMKAQHVLGHEPEVNGLRAAQGTCHAEYWQTMFYEPPHDLRHTQRVPGGGRDRDSP
jgi:hypothetical protein